MLASATPSFFMSLSPLFSFGNVLLGSNRFTLGSVRMPMMTLCSLHVWVCFSERPEKIGTLRFSFLPCFVLRIFLGIPSRRVSRLLTAHHCMRLVRGGSALKLQCDWPILAMLWCDRPRHYFVTR